MSSHGGGGDGGDGGGGGGGAAAMPAGPQHICCWLCGFPIADMASGIFPDSNKSTGVAKRRKGWWGMGVGEHVLQPAPGTGYVGIFQRSYGMLNKTAGEAREKEFLKKEIRWAHRYCNTIKSTLLFVTRPHGELLEVVDSRVIVAFLADLWGGHYKPNGIDRGYLRDQQFEVASTNGGSPWRNLIHYWIDRTNGNNFKKKINAWIEYQTIAINLALQNLVDDVNLHNSRDPKVLDSNYNYRVRNPKSGGLRSYQQQDYVPTMSNYCFEIIGHDINRPGEQVAEEEEEDAEADAEDAEAEEEAKDELRLVNPEELSNSQEAEENEGEENEGEETTDETESKTPPSGGGGGQAGDHRTPPDLRSSEAMALLAQRRAAYAQGTATRNSLPLSLMGGRTREKYEGIAKCNEQVWALWGDYGGYDKEKIASWTRMYAEGGAGGGAGGAGGAGGGAGNGDMERNHRKRKTRRRKNRRRSTRKRAQ